MSDVESAGAPDEVQVEVEEEDVKDLKTAIKRVSISQIYIFIPIKQTIAGSYRSQGGSRLCI